MRRFFLTDAARLDIQRVLCSSQDLFGVNAARRYQTLIDLALKEVRRSPDRPTAKSAGVGDLRQYALRLASRRMPSGRAVRAPPHVVIYRYDDTMVEVVRLLHAAMDLPSQLADLDDGGG